MCYGVGKVGFRCCAVLCYAMLCWGGRQPPAAASALAHSWSLLCAQLPTGLHCIKLAETSAKPSVKSKGRREVPPAAPLGWQLTTPIPKVSAGEAWQFVQPPARHLLFCGGRELLHNRER